MADFTLSGVANDATLQTGGVGLTQLNTTVHTWSAISDEEWFRFTSVTIPKNSTISAATLTVYASTAGSGTITNAIYGEAADNSAVITTDDTIGSRSFGTVGANAWAMSNPASAGDPIISSDISDVIQQIVSRSGWASGNALLLRVVTTITGGKGSTRSVRTLDNSFSPKAAVLSITYSPPGSNLQLNMNIGLNLMLS